MHHQYNTQLFYVMPTHRIYVLCVDLSTNRHFLSTALKYHPFCSLFFTLILTLENKYLSEYTVKSKKLGLYADYPTVWRNVVV